MTSLWRYPYALLGIVFVLIGYTLWAHERPIPVLIYHDVAANVTDPTAYTIDTALLARELDYLRENEYTPLTFSVAEMLRTNDRLPKHPVIITFDDALPGQRTYALSALVSRGIPATIFIPSGLVGDSAHMSWEQVRSIASAGMEIGGHTKTHAHLLSLTDALLSTEVLDDKRSLQQELGKAVDAFAYPFQESDSRTDAIVRGAGYIYLRDDTSLYKNTVMTNSFDEFLKAL